MPSRRKATKNAELREESIQRLSQAAFQLIVMKGYHATTLQEIADAAAMTKGAIFFYFTSKERLLLHLLDIAEAHIVDSPDRPSVQRSRHRGRQDHRVFPFRIAARHQTPLRAVVFDPNINRVSSSVRRHRKTDRSHLQSNISRPRRDHRNRSGARRIAKGFGNSRARIHGGRHPRRHDAGVSSPGNRRRAVGACRQNHVPERNQRAAGASSKRANR